MIVFEMYDKNDGLINPGFHYFLNWRVKEYKQTKVYKSLMKEIDEKNERIKHVYRWKVRSIPNNKEVSGKVLEWIRNPHYEEEE